MSNGNKYEATKNLDIAVIAQLVRDDIKAALADGTLLKGTKCGVRISRFAGGRSMRITIKAFAGQVWTDEFIGSDPRRCFEGERRTAIAQSTVHVLERILRAYNYDNSDIMTDYFDVRFYSSVEFDHAVSIADRAATEARLNGLVDLSLTDMAMAAAANF